VIARKAAAGGAVSRTRPLGPYPPHPEYTGRGSTQDAGRGELRLPVDDPCGTRRLPQLHSCGHRLRVRGGLESHGVVILTAKPRRSRMRPPSQVKSPTCPGFGQILGSGNARIVQFGLAFYF